MDKTWAARMLVAVRTRDHGMAAVTRLDPLAARLRAARGLGHHDPSWLCAIFWPTPHVQNAG